MKTKITEDKQTVRIDVNRTLSVTELETLITGLGQIRNAMTPPVPFVTPGADSQGELPNVSVQDDPYFSLRLLRDGRIRVWLRNQGLGWMIFNLPVEKACAMRDYLVANTPEIDSETNLLLNESGGSGTAH